jgi:hypothetical protein
MNPEDDSLVGEEAGAGTDEHASEPVTHAAEDGGEEELLGCSVDEAFTLLCIFDARPAAGMPSFNERPKLRRPAGGVSRRHESALVVGRSGGRGECRPAVSFAEVDRNPES